jgi:hypothetical protein
MRGRLTKATPLSSYILQKMKVHITVPVRE